ncbi:MAG TPA: MFS transporter [Caulobacteraceae bacterium]|nr:MFS transporter [Caulobacteraceae bacterium]
MALNLSPRGPLWRHGDFLKLWGAQTVSDFGARITREGVPYAAVLTVGANPVQMGFLAALSLGPSVAVGLMAGGLVDRSRRRRVLIAADLARAAVLAVIPLSAIMHWFSMAELYVAAFIVGALSVLFDIADHAYLPSLVERSLITDANAKLAVTESVAEIGGPALTGLLVGLLTAPLAIAVNAVTYLASAALLAGIRHAEAPPKPGPATTLASDLRAGFKVAMGEPLVRAPFLTNLVTGFFGAAFSTCYMLFAIRVLGFPPALLGLVIAMGGVGALAGALTFTALSRAIGLGPATVVSGIVSAASALLIPAAGGSLALALAMMIASQLLGDSFGVAVIIGSKSLQQAVLPPGVLGRAGAAMRAAAGAAGVVGALAAGFTAVRIGVRPTLFIGAAGLVAAQIFLIASPLMRLRMLPPSASAV